MGKREDKVKSKHPPEGAMETTIEELVVSYASSMHQEDVVETMKEMGLSPDATEMICRIIIAQAWAIQDILSGPLKGVKLYVDNRKNAGLH